MPRASESCCRSSGSRLAVPALALLSLCLATAPGPAVAESPAGSGGGPATAEPPARTAYVERAEVNLSLIEIVVLDRRGRHVRGLPASAFHLFERGREVPVASVDEIDLSARAEARSRGAAPASPPPQGPPAAAGGAPGAPAKAPSGALLAARRRDRPRWFVLLFDGYDNPSMLRMNELRRAAKKWLSENLREQDVAAVYEMTPNLSSVAGFTHDVVDLRMAIDRVRIFPASDIRDTAVRDTLQQGERMSPGTTTGQEVLQQRLQNAAQFGGDLLSADRDQFYVNVGDAANVLTGVDGTKAILLFSGGFPLTRTRSTAARGGITPRFATMLDSLERAGIRVFTFDVGMEGGFTDAEKAENLGQMLDEVGLGQEWLEQLQMGSSVDAVNAHQEILAVLGNETGGRFLRGRDFEAELESASDDLNHYYLVGYEPPAPGARGRSYVPIRVEIEGPGGLHAVARKGRFLDEVKKEPVVEAAAAAPGTGGAAPARAELRNDLAVSCRPLFYPFPDGRTLVVLPVQVAGPVPTASSGNGGYELDLDLVVAAALSGADVRRSERNVRARLRSDSGPALGRGIQLRDAIVLPAAPVDITVSLRLNGLERSGKWSGLLRVPERSASRFGLTDLALLSTAAPVPVVFDVFSERETITGTVPPAPVDDPLGTDARGRPPAYVGGKIPRSAALLAQTRVTAAPRADTGQSSPLRMDWELVPEAGGAPVAPPVRYTRLQLVADGALDVVAALDLGTVPPGAYAMRLTATNLKTREEDVRTVPVEIGP